ncbi:MAG: HAMP domain-containing protein, partial [Cyanobacteria bacterium M_surface_10_m2_119]|nr:HAMP domain-containing protein [Cyanobacteria bacterium M_surface_10_m2_119]
MPARRPARPPTGARSSSRRSRCAARPGSGAAAPITSGLRGGRVLLVALPQRELLAGANRLLRETWLLTLLLVLAALPVVWLFARLLARPLRRLAEQAAAIRGFAFDAGEPVRSLVREIDELAGTFEGMRTTIRSFLQSSAALGAEPDPEQLLERLLVDTIASSAAVAGVLYRAEGDLLLPGQARGVPLASLPALPLAVSEASGAAEVRDPCGLRLPLRSRAGDLQGLLELRFAEPPEPARVAFCTALSGSAAVAL